MLRSWIQKHFRKADPLHAIVLLGLLGMGCILVSSFLAPEEEEVPVQEAAASAETPEAYRQRMETELEVILTSISGVGSVQVLVTVGGSEEYHYATEGDSLVSEDQVKRSSSYVTIGGSKGEALMESVTNPPITGVVVACEGGDRSTVQEAVYNAVSVACGISTAKIYVTRLDTSAAN